jgi:adenosylcobinamide kinase/adenosylcobinamide-phosphate guanylyltransferase
MKILICGGCKNGKTALALSIAEKLSENRKRYYVAAMIPYDDEDRARIKRHIAEREGRGFVTLETGRDIAACLQDDDGVYLIDSVTALLTNEMFPPDGAVDMFSEKRCTDGLLTVARGAHDAIFVTDDIFSDAGRYDGITEAYRSALGAMNRALAQECDTVIELCAGSMIVHKGGFAL